MERLHAPVEHLGEPGDRGDIGDRQAGVAQRPRRAARRHELEAARDQAAGQLDQAGLVAHREERAARDGDAGVGHDRIERHPATVAAERAGQERRDRSGEQPMLDRVEPGGERGLVIGRQDRHRLLGDDRTAIQRLVDQVDRDARDRDTRRQRVTHGMHARERRQQRRMDIEDAARPTRRGHAARRAAGSPARTRASPDAEASASHTRVVAAPGDQRRVDPLLRGPVERRAGSIGDDQRDVATELAASSRADQRPQVRAGATTRDREAVTRPLTRQRDPPRTAPRRARPSRPPRRSPSDSTPAAPRIASAASTSAGATTTTIPRPPLNVARSSSSAMPPRAPSQRMTDGIRQRAGRAGRPGRRPASAARCPASHRR